MAYKDTVAGTGADHTMDRTAAINIEGSFLQIADIHVLLSSKKYNQPEQQSGEQQSHEQQIT